jgi:hypothetical protein
MLGDQTTLARAAEKKDLFRELKDELTKCRSPSFREISSAQRIPAHQVTDILRDRLLHNVSHLADAQGRIRELEEERRGALNDLLLLCHNNKTELFRMLTDGGKHQNLVKFITFMVCL